MCNEAVLNRKSGGRRNQHLCCAKVHHRSRVCSAQSTTDVTQGSPDTPRSNCTMDSSRRRCGVAAAAAVALLANVADVQGFAFTLQLPGKQAGPTATKQQRALGSTGRRAANAQDVCATGQRCGPVVSGLSSWNSRRSRTTVRYGKGDARVVRGYMFVGFAFFLTGNAAEFSG